jgi:hypothetical protein
MLLAYDVSSEDSIMKRLIFLLLFFSVSLPMVGVAQQTAPAKTVDERSDQLLRKMSDLLANAGSMTLKVKEVRDKIRATGEKIQVRNLRDIAVRRPDGIWIRAVSQTPDQSRDYSLWYDGKTLTLQSDKEKVYAHTKMPPTIDEAFDFAGSTLNLPTPMADILYSSPYDAFMSAETTGGYVKLDKVEEKSCHELAFQNPVVDWRIWIADGDQPLPCQLEITYKLDEGSPKINMTFLDWNLSPQLAADLFTHQPPANYQRIKIIGRVPVEEEQPAGANPQTQENQQ